MKYDPRTHGALCQECPLRDCDPVPPEGPRDPELVLVGEAPGYWEERKRQPFVGPSGVMLNDLLWRAGIKRDRIWITNTILCRAKIPEMGGKDAYDVKKYTAWLRAQNNLRKKEAKATGRDPELYASPFDCCAPRLFAELAHADNAARARGQVNGAVVMPLGNFAMKTILGREGIMKLRGSPFVVDLSDPHKPEHEKQIAKLIGGSK